jgi:hypothetical protein
MVDTKGQVFTLDFLFSVIIVVFVAGTLLNITEIKVFSDAQDTQLHKLSSVGMLASDMLVNNAPNLCELMSNDLQENLGYLNNCLYTGVTVTKASLGLDSAYGCSITTEPITGGQITLPTECTDTYTERGDAYSVKRIAVIKDGGSTVTKAELVRCMQKKADCELLPHYVMLKVWEK